MKKLVLFCAVFTLFLIPEISLAAGEKFGEAADPKVPQVKLAEIMKNPAAYKNQEVVLEGNYAGHCCPTDFNYKEGVHGVECYYPGFNVPKTKAGRPVKIYATVRVRQQEDDKEPQVHLEAKGVQFK